MNNSPLTGFSQPGPQVGVLIHFPNTSIPPFNLYIASKDPVNVIHPTKADNPAATMVTVAPKPGDGAVVSIHFQHSESATSADAAPPNPLKRATISGIPVISTFTAIMYPIIEPTAIPATIRVQLIIPSWPKFMSAIVVITATNIPNIPYWFPLGAVLGCPSFFSPKMNNAADTR